MNRYDDHRDHPRGYGDEGNLRPRGGDEWRNQNRQWSPRDSEKGTPRHGDEHERHREDDRRRNYLRSDQGGSRDDRERHSYGYDRDRHDQRRESYGQRDRYDLGGYDREDLRGSMRPDNDRNGRGLEGESMGRDRRRDRQASHMEDERQRREQGRGEFRHHDDRSHESRSFDGRREHGERRHEGERHDSARMREGRAIGGGRDGWREQERDSSRERIDRAGRDTEYRNDWNYEGPRFTRGGREVDPDDFDEYRGRDAGFSWRDGSNSATWRDMDRWGNEYSNHSRSEGFGWNRGSTRDPNFWSSPDRER